MENCINCGNYISQIVHVMFNEQTRYVCLVVRCIYDDLFRKRCSDVVISQLKFGYCSKIPFVSDMGSLKRHTT